jgi:trehalose-phosphatase
MTRRLLDALNEIREQVHLARHLLICLDFDGTLTPIVEHPDRADLAAPMRQRLRDLAAKENISVAVLSGRQRTDIQARVSVPGLIYSGNHGLEISGPGFIFIEPTAVHSRDELKKLVTDLTPQIQSVPGAFVEDKGLTLSVHYRQVAPAGWEEVRRRVHAVLTSSSHPFVLTQGNMVFEIRPRVYWDKGAAVHWIKEQLNHQDALVVYLGDDVSDEDAFAVLSEGITVKVGGPPETTAAQYHLEGPIEVEDFLGWLGVQMHRVGGGVQC